MLSDAKSREEREERQRYHPKPRVELTSMHRQRPGPNDRDRNQPKPGATLPLRTDEEPHHPRRSDSSKHPPGTASSMPAVTPAKQRVSAKVRMAAAGGTRVFRRGKGQLRPFA